MRAEVRGIVVNKAELGALLEFASKDLERSLSNISFRVDQDKLYGYATDGRRAVESIGVATDMAFPGEWQIGRAYVEELRKLLGGTDRAVLQTSGGSIREAMIEDEDGTARSTVAWPHDAVSGQVTIPMMREAIRPPDGAKRVVCMSLPASQLASIGLVGKAAGWDVVDVYAPKGRTDPIIFRVDGQTTWTGAIMPVRGDEETED